MLSASETDPRVLDDQFAELFPAFDLKTTANSGAFHGDGDLRGHAVRYDRATFALESKARFSPTYKHCRPKPDEWEKAMGGVDKRGKPLRGQLRAFDRTALRFFLVYLSSTGRWGLSIPAADVAALKAIGIEPSGSWHTLRRWGRTERYQFVDESGTVDLHHQTERYLAALQPDPTHVQ